MDGALANGTSSAPFIRPCPDGSYRPEAVDHPLCFKADLDLQRPSNGSRSSRAGGTHHRPHRSANSGKTRCRSVDLQHYVPSGLPGLNHLVCSGSFFKRKPGSHVMLQHAAPEHSGERRDGSCAFMNRKVIDDKKLELNVSRDQWKERQLYRAGAAAIDHALSAGTKHLQVRVHVGGQIQLDDAVHAEAVRELEHAFSERLGLIEHEVVGAGASR